MLASMPRNASRSNAQRLREQ